MERAAQVVPRAVLEVDAFRAAVTVVGRHINLESPARAHPVAGILGQERRRPMRLRVCCNEAQARRESENDNLKQIHESDSTEANQGVDGLMAAGGHPAANCRFE